MDINKYSKKIMSIWNSKRALLFVGVVNNKAFELKVKKFSGIRTLFRINCGEEKIIHLDKHIELGEMEVLAVNKETIIKIVSGDNTLPIGKYRIRVLGESASGNIKLTQTVK